MIINKACSCGYQGKVYMPEKSIVTNMIITCPRCKQDEDMSYLYKDIASLEEIERKEYERLKAKYG